MITMSINEKYRDCSWDFKGANTKIHTHGFHPYPAMMIPQVAGKLLDIYGVNAKLLFDPYCGTGTSLVEANLRGINAIGTDINPLARVMAKVKTTFIPIDLLDHYIFDFKEYLQNYNLDDVVIPDFKNIEYWFKENTIFELSVIKSYIDNKINDENVKNFFKVAWSSTIRDVSLTRNSEFKLYRMPPNQIEKFNPYTYKIMIDKLLNNKNNLQEYMRIKQGDAKSKIYGFNTVESIPKNIIPDECVDIVITSPPYGDSRTTVAYGQFSRLSCQWLNIENATKIDKLCMGGGRIKTKIEFDYEPLDNAIEVIYNQDKKRAEEVISFYKDYKLSINNVSKSVKIGGIVAYTVGNRTVKGTTLPTDEITKEFFERNGFTHIKTMIRAIPNKRMPKKNSPSNVSGKVGKTMNYEYIVILKKEE